MSGPQNLCYATVATDRHTIRVTTWTDPGTGDTRYEMHVDGRLIDEGTAEYPESEDS